MKYLLPALVCLLCFSFNGMSQKSHDLAVVDSKNHTRIQHIKAKTSKQVNVISKKTKIVKQTKSNLENNEVLFQRPKNHRREIDKCKAVVSRHQ